MRIVVRLLLIPVIAGLSYELLRAAGRTENRLIQVLSKPGLWMQRLTVREPDDEMIQVGIASVGAVVRLEKLRTGGPPGGGNGSRRKAAVSRKAGHRRRNRHDVPGGGEGNRASAEGCRD